jgi:hypothetical protein
MRTQNQVVVPLKDSEKPESFFCRVKKTITSGVEDLKVAVDIAKSNTPAGKCKAERPSLWRMEEGRKGLVVAKHNLSSESRILFPSQYPAPEGVEVDTWYNVFIPVVALAVTTQKQTPTGIKQANKESELFFELIKPNLVGVGAELPPDAVLYVRRCQTGQFNVKEEASTYFRKKEQKTEWNCIRADKLLDDEQWGDFAKIFVSSKSDKHNNLFDGEQNGEFMFLIIEFCNEFSNFSSFFPDLEARKTFCQSLRVDADSGDQLLSKFPLLAKSLREMRNVLAHSLERMLRPPSDKEMKQYESIIKDGAMFLAVIKKILKGLRRQGCIREDEESLYKKAKLAAANGLDELRNSGPNIEMNHNMLAELIRIMEGIGTNRKGIDEMIRQLRVDVSMPRLLCSLVEQSGSFLHAYLSDDLSGDSELLKSMYAEASIMPGLGPHCDGFPWPEEFKLIIEDKKKKTGLRLYSEQIYVQPNKREGDSDPSKRRDLDARDVHALSKSMMFIPVFTLKLMNQLSQPVLSKEAERFLFRLILAREFHETSKEKLAYSGASARNLYPCALIRPVFLVQPFEIDDSRLSNQPLEELYSRARKKLQVMRRNIDPTSEAKKLSLQDLFKYFFEHNVDDGLNDELIINATKRLLYGIRAEIQNLYMETMAYNFPQSAELASFLSNASMTRYAPIFARHSIHSVQSFSSLDAAGSCLASVAKEAARLSQLTPEVESKLLLDAIAVAKKCPFAQPINVRFDKYVDKDASFCTAAFSSSGFDILFSKTLGQCFFCATGVVVLTWSVQWSIKNLYDRDFECAGNPAIDLRWHVLKFLIGLLLLSTGLFLSCAASLIDPKLAKRIIFLICLTNALRVGILDIYLIDAFVYQRCPVKYNWWKECCFEDIHGDYPLSSSFSFSTYVHLRLLVSVFDVMFWVIFSIAVLLRQSICFSLFFGYHSLLSFIYIFFDIMMGQPAGRTFEKNFPQLLLGMWIAFKALEWYGRHLSMKIANRDAPVLNDIWLKSSQRNNSERQFFTALKHRSSAVQQHADISRIFQQHEFINGAFQVAYEVKLCYIFIVISLFIPDLIFTFPLQTWIGSLLKDGPQFEEQGLFSLFDSPRPKSIEILYDTKAQHSAISSKFSSEWSGKWSQPQGTFIPGPIKVVDRAISKIYRAYAGDVRRITDIVRCTVVLDTMDDIDNFMMMMEATGWVEQYDFNDAKQQVRQGEIPLNLGQWSVIIWHQKLQLLALFAWSYFKLHFLGLPQDEEILEAANARQGAFQIVRVKNRFEEKSPVGGYRDVNIKVRIGFKSNPILSSPVFVPVENWGDAGVQTVVCEIQVISNDVWLLSCLSADILSGSLT